MSAASACSVRASMTGRTPPPSCAGCVTISLRRRRCRCRRCCRPRSGGAPAASCKLALAIAQEATRRAGVDPAELASVFSSSGGDGHNCHEICQALALAGRELSPTRFSNSVHNAAAGYWSIATGAKRESNVLCAFDASFCAGLLEALAHVVVEEQPVLLVAYDTDYPEPLHAKRPIPDAFGSARSFSRRIASAARWRASQRSLAKRTCRRA